MADTSHPGCTVDGCTNKAAFTIIHDNRMVDQYRCFECVIDHINRELS